ncbi:MAG TPA: hypothetical protein VGL00_18390 [Terracidiphilus sp.]
MKELRIPRLELLVLYEPKLLASAAWHRPVLSENNLLFGAPNAKWCETRVFPGVSPRFPAALSAANQHRAQFRPISLVIPP